MPPVVIMLSNTQRPTTSILVTQCDSWRGYYVAAALLKLTLTSTQNPLAVIAAVRNPANDYARELALQGAHLRTFDPQSDANDLLNDIDTLVLIPSHLSNPPLAHTLALSMMRAAESSARCTRVLMWSSAAVLGLDRRGPHGGGWAVLEAVQSIERLVLDANGIQTKLVLRPGFMYQQLFGLAYAVQGRGKVPFVSPNNTFAPVDAKDVAMLAAKLASVEDAEWMRKWNGMAVTVVGPEEVSGHGLVEAMNRALGSEPQVQLEQVDWSEMKQVLGEGGVLDEFDVQLTLELMHLIAAGDLSRHVAADELESILGKNLTYLSDFLDKNVAVFRPSGEAKVMKSIHRPTGPGGKVEGGGIPLTDEEAALMYEQ